MLPATVESGLHTHMCGWCSHIRLLYGVSSCHMHQICRNQNGKWTVFGLSTLSICPWFLHMTINSKTDNVLAKKRFFLFISSFLVTSRSLININIAFFLYLILTVSSQCSKSIPDSEKKNSPPAYRGYLLLLI